MPYNHIIVVISVCLKSFASQDNSPSPSMFSDQGGYYKFPNGLIMQWGVGNWITAVMNQSSETYNFPIPFPHKCLSVNLTIELQRHDVTFDFWYQLEGFNQYNFTTSLQGASSTGVNDVPRVNYFAIGY